MVGKGVRSKIPSENVFVILYTLSSVFRWSLVLSFKMSQTNSEYEKIVASCCDGEREGATAHALCGPNKLLVRVNRTWRRPVYSATDQRWALSAQFCRSLLTFLLLVYTQKKKKLRAKKQKNDHGSISSRWQCFMPFVENLSTAFLSCNARRPQKMMYM